MHGTRIGTAVAMTFLFLSATILLGQVGSQAGVPNLKPPTDAAVDFKSADLDAASSELAAKKLSSYGLLAAEGYDMEIRRLAGRQPLMAHDNTEIVVVRAGEGTFVTGGEIV